MNEAVKSSQAQICPQCGSRRPVDALPCGRGRKYFGVANDGHGHSLGSRWGHGHHSRKDGTHHQHEGRGV